MTDDIPESHPRSDSLRTRDRLVKGVDRGITSQHGLIAHGRGEAFDYLMGERTIATADSAAKVAAAELLLAEHPVVSVNGNVAALVPDETVELATTVGADIEINLFHRTETRIRAIADHLRDHGAKELKGLTADARIPGLDHDRARTAADGIAAADVVVIPLEDGDRATALSEMGKTEIVIDLNPLSRSARAASIPIVDNVVRAIPNITSYARDLQTASASDLRTITETFDADSALAAAERRIRTGVASPTTDDGS